MNFYENNISGKKYLKILTNYNRTISKKFLLQNIAMFCGNKSYYRILKCHELIKKTSKIKGNIIEFGIWNGNNLFSIKKIVDYFKLKKKVIGYDNFSGFPNPTKNKKKGKYIGNKKLIKYIIKFFKFKSIQIIDDDIYNLKNHKKKIGKVSFVYIDCDIYKPVKIILNTLNTKISKGGIIAFDEGNRGINKGEKKALNEFYKKNKSKYRRVFLKKNYQPDVILEKK
ncbi:MAG: hypothetical protein CMI79_02410 [Candidatus Pelagibacter sp.]|nr:hypothetical protein [Candidatus Pelagibacter sp.]|tara:strand:+ start:2571 stop:3248 length:678 start_codon:yes stop_codon:yes gene_type:complete